MQPEVLRSKVATPELHPPFRCFAPVPSTVVRSESEPEPAPSDAGASGVDALFPVVYGELRGLAHRYLRGERKGHSLDTTALVHEAYLKLSGLDRIEWKSKRHFLAVAAQAMRRVLVDHAVARNAQKRGGSWSRVSLERLHLGRKDHDTDILALNEALRRLEESSPRQCRVVECRFFAGMTIDETAGVLGVSPSTVKSDWAHARAWLNRELDV